MVRSRPFLLALVCAWTLLPVATFADGHGGDNGQDESKRQPFQQTIFVSTLNTPTPLVTVPHKKRLVIEFFSAEAFVGAGETMSRFFISTHKAGLPPGTNEFTHFIGVTSQGPSFGQETFLASQSMRMYVKAGDELVLNAVGDGTGGAFMSVSGYFLDVK